MKAVWQKEVSLTDRMTAVLEPTAGDMHVCRFNDRATVN
jgi:hypothetical protein